MMRQIVWTRSREDWTKDEQLLRSSKQAYLHLPCIKVVPKSFKVDNVAEFKNAIFTSPKSVELVRKNSAAMAFLRKVKSFAFGQATCAELERAKLDYEKINADSAQRMTAELVNKLEKEAGAAVFQAEEPAYDIASEFHAKGFKTESIILYETVPDLKLIDKDVQIYQKTLNGVICFASPSAVEVFVSTFQPQNNAIVKNCQVAVIGKTTEAKAKEFFPTVHVAKQSKLVDLVALASELL